MNDVARCTEIVGIPRERICKFFKIRDSALDFEFFENWVWWWRHLDKYEQWLFSQAEEIGNPPGDLYLFSRFRFSQHLAFKMSFHTRQMVERSLEWVSLELKSRVERDENWRPAALGPLQVANLNEVELKLPASLKSGEYSRKERLRILDELMKEKLGFSSPGRKEKPGFHHLEIIDLYSHFPSAGRTDLRRKVYEAHDLSPDTEASATDKFIKRQWR